MKPVKEKDPTEVSGGAFTTTEPIDAVMPIFPFPPEFPKEPITPVPILEDLN